MQALYWLGMYVFGIHKALYAIIAVYLVTKVSDGLIEGLKFSKAAYIITAKPKEIADMIMKDAGQRCNRHQCQRNVLRTG